MTLADNKTTKIKVLEFLKRCPVLRDNDLRLVANIWKTEVNYQDMSAKDLLQAMADGRLTHPESIRRIRQKLQQEDPHLRGEKYLERHLVREPQEREAINSWQKSELF